MKVFGIDFTSAPTPRKPIICVSGYFKRGSLLNLDYLETFPHFSSFEEFLKRKGPWLAGVDFPLGLPLSFLHHLKLKTDWSLYVHSIGKWDKNHFESNIIDFKNKRIPGQKEPLRITDMFANAKSPLKLVNPPVGKMFYEGATRLLRSSVSVIPCRPKKDNRIVFESYPALTARKFVKKYKNETTRSGSLKNARKTIINGIISTNTTRQFGFQTRIKRDLQIRGLEDSNGDILDAILCAIQVAWAYSQKKNYCPFLGIDKNVIYSEGWIINPYFNQNFREKKA